MSGREHILTYGPRAKRYVDQQRRFYERLGFSGVGEHGRTAFERGCRYNVVTLGALENERASEGHNGVLAQVLLHHVLASPDRLPSNLAPDRAWIGDEHQAFCDLRALDTNPDSTLADYHTGPLGRRIHGVPPLAFLVRMVDLTTFPDPHLLTQMPHGNTDYFPTYREPDFDVGIIAGKALLLYAPFAEGLGYGPLCRDIKDLAVSYLYPDVTTRVRIRMLELEEAKLASDQLLGVVLRELNARFNGELSTTIRKQKSVGSSVLKTLDPSRPYNDIEDFPDLSASFVVVNSVEDIYRVASMLVGTNDNGIITNAFRTTAPDCQFITSSRDHVSRPKQGSLDGYRSYHINVIVNRRGNRTDPVNFEIIIRTRAMHEHCERGTAAHYMYKGMGDDPTAQKTTLANYDRALLDLAAGSLVAVPGVGERLAHSMLRHDNPVVVTIKLTEGKSQSTRTIWVKERACVFDALVAADIDVSSGISVQGCSFTERVVNGQFITARVGVGAPKLGQAIIKELLGHHVSTPKAVGALGSMLLIKNGNGGKHKRNGKPRHR